MNNWTKEKPTKPGFYWMRSFRDFHDDKAHAVQLDDNKCVWFIGSELDYPMSDFPNSEWSGPIEPPTE